jgi:hypothetical protein
VPSGATAGEASTQSPAVAFHFNVPSAVSANSAAAELPTRIVPSARTVGVERIGSPVGNRQRSAPAGVRACR